MPTRKNVVEIQVLTQMITSNQLGDVASELEYIEGDLDHHHILDMLLEKCCETEDHELILKICQEVDTESLSKELRKKICNLKESCEVNDDFAQNIPTLVDITVPF